MIVVFIAIRIRDSRLGRAWIALREDEVAAVSMGIPLVRTKLWPTRSAPPSAGSPACFSATSIRPSTPVSSSSRFSVFVLAMVIVGGLGSVWGAVIGRAAALLHELLPDPGRAQHPAARPSGSTST